MNDKCTKYADLHIHSTASDGRFRPTEIVQLAREIGFACIALADHDTVGGVEEAVDAGQSTGVEVIPAVELSTLYDGGEVHILGYFINWRAKGLLSKLQEIMNARDNRARTMVEKLQKLGITIQWDEVCSKAGSSFVGRPHIAGVLLEKGYISQLGEAFTEKYIGSRGRAYVERYEMSPREAIQLINSNGGVAVLAHPGIFKNKRRVRLDEKDIRCFLDHGLQGLEVLHTKHSPEDTEYYSRLANKYSLAITGGSDCHGGNTGEILMGKIRLHYEYVNLLRDLINRGGQICNCHRAQCPPNATSSA